jgi:T5SS/PEP-CTERM-associated repeat protein
MKSCLFLAISVGMSLLDASRVLADNCNWISPTGGQFAEPGNWAPHAPQAADTAIFTLSSGSPYQVDFNTAAAINELQMRRGAVDFNLAGHALSVNSNLFVGYQAGDIGYLHLLSGQLSTAWADVGHGFANTGQLAVSGSGTSWVNSQDVTIGRGSTGAVNVYDGGAVTVQRDTYVGNCVSGEATAGDGTIDLGDANSSWTTTRLIVGTSGNGGTYATGSVHVHDGASLVANAQFSVGSGATGYLTIDGGAAVSSKKAASASGTSCALGASYPNYPGEGTATVSGSGTTWTQDGSLGVGFTGRGTLTITAGAVVESQAGHIARRTGSDGTVTVIDGGSLWKVNSELYVGGEADPSRGGLGSGGAGRLYVAFDGGVTVASRLDLWADGQVDITGGGRMLVGAGTLPADPDTLLIGAGGTLAGTGAFTGKVVNAAGTVSPGHSAGMLSIDGNFTQGASGKLAVDVLPLTAEWDRVHASGTVNLGGELALSVSNPSALDYGDSFQVLSAGGIQGKFSRVTGSAQGKARLAAIYHPTDVTLVAAFPGDADLNGRVDLLDLVALAGHYQGPGQTGNGWAQGDFDQNGVVDLLDLCVLAGNYGKSVPISSGMLPEPATLALLALGAAMLLGRRPAAREGRRAAP